MRSVKCWTTRADAQVAVHGDHLQFWQDRASARGLWRRTTWAEYESRSRRGKQCSTLTHWRATKKELGLEKCAVLAPALVKVLD